MDFGLFYAVPGAVPVPGFSVFRSGSGSGGLMFAVPVKPGHSNFDIIFYWH